MAIPSGGGARTPAAPTNYPVLTLAGLSRSGSPPAPPASSARPPTLASTAAGLAAQNVAAQVAAIRQQQAADEADARARAGLITRASTAAADYLGPGGLDLAGATKQDYADALAQTQGLASGYSDQFRQNAAGQQQAGQNTLSAIPGNDQTVRSQGGSLADLLYGLRGVVPGTALATEGLGATAAARTLGAAVRATGANEALGVLGTGRADARALDPRIAAAQGQIPSLTERYLGDLVSQQAKLAAATAPKLYSTGGGLYSYDPTTGTLTTLKAPAAAAGTTPSINDAASRSTGVLTYVGTDGQLHAFTDAKGKTIPYVSASTSSGDFSLSPGGARYDANGNLIASVPATPSSSGSGDFTIGNTRYRSDGTPIVTNKTAGGSTGLSPASTRTAVTAFQRLAKENAQGAPTSAQGSPFQYVTGGDPTIPAGTAGSAWITNPNYVPGKPGTPTPYWETVNQGVLSGLSLKRAVQITNNTRGYDRMGINGRPYVGAAARTESVKGARQAIRAGATLQEALAAAAAAGLIDPRIYTPIFRKAYSKLLGVKARGAGTNTAPAVTPAATATTTAGTVPWYSAGPSSLYTPPASLIPSR